MKAYDVLPYRIPASFFVLEQKKMIKEIEDTIRPFKVVVEKCWETIMQLPQFNELSNQESFKERINAIESFAKGYVECPEDVKKCLEPMTSNFPRKPTFFHQEKFKSCEVIEEKEGSIKIIIDAKFFKQYKNDLAWIVIFEHENGHVRLGHHRDPSVFNKIIIEQSVFSSMATKLEKASELEKALEKISIELYHCREKQADIFALQQPNITLNHMIAFKQFIEKHKMEASLTHPSSTDRARYIDRLIRAYIKDIECNDAPLD